MIELQNVTKLYGAVIGVNDVSLSLPPGAYGLLGPNGSGKTTLLQLLTGQIRPTLGSIKLFGASPSQSNETLKKIGFCPASDVLYTTVSALDWVTYLCELYGYSRSEAKTRSVEALEMVGLTDAMNRAMGNYSRGMKQRSKLAQAIVHDPDFLILDEPFTGLDPLARHEMTQFLKQWIRNGKSLMLASHILHEVEAISQSFLLIFGGRLLASGNVEDVHTLLADVPTEITIRCNDARLLAQLFIGSEVATNIQLKDIETLVLSTQNPLALYEKLPELMSEHNLTVSELSSDAESLQALFDSLLRIHRGEIA